MLRGVRHLLHRLGAGFLLILLSTSLCRAQETDWNDNLWFQYFGSHPIGTNGWGVHLEGQLRLADMGSRWQQILLRPGVNYSINPSVMLSAGYCFIEAYPYGGFPVPHQFPINATWEQVLWRADFLGLRWVQRFRLEQRWIGVVLPQPGGGWAVEDWRYENRFRYMLRTTIPFKKQSPWYVALWDEVFINFGENVLLNQFDQNRATVALGRKLSKTVNLEVGYMLQTLQRRGGRIWEQNNTVMVSLFSTTPF